MDDQALINEHPSRVVFDGAVKALAGERAMEGKVGERIRIFFGMARHWRDHTAVLILRGTFKGCVNGEGGVPSS